MFQWWTYCFCQLLENKSINAQQDLYKLIPEVTSLFGRHCASFLSPLFLQEILQKCCSCHSLPFLLSFCKDPNKDSSVVCKSKRLSNLWRIICEDHLSFVSTFVSVAAAKTVNWKQVNKKKKKKQRPANLKSKHSDGNGMVTEIQFSNNSINSLGCWMGRNKKPIESYTWECETLLLLCFETNPLRLTSVGAIGLNGKNRVLHTLENVELFFCCALKQILWDWLL